MSEVLGGQGLRVSMKESLPRAKYKDHGPNQLGKKLKGRARVCGWLGLRLFR